MRGNQDARMSYETQQRLALSMFRTDTKWAMDEVGKIVQMYKNGANAQQVMQAIREVKAIHGVKPKCSKLSAQARLPGA